MGYLRLKMGELKEWVCLYLRVKTFLFRERCYVREHFASFFPYEKALDRAYRFSNPFQMCRRVLAQRGVAQVNGYGETPLPVFAQVAHACALSEKDHVLEMGCGRGRGALFLSHITGCRVTGVDWVPQFVMRAERIVERVSPRLAAHFVCGEREHIDLNPFSCIYLFGTCLEEEEIERLVKRMESLSSSVRIVTVSYPLSDYSPKMHTVAQWTASFPWGEGEIYVNQVRAEASLP